MHAIDPMDIESERFFEVILDVTHEVAVVVQASDENQAWIRALQVQDQLYPQHNLRVSAARVRLASLPFKGPTFSTGYFHVLDEIRGHSMNQ